MNDEPNFLDDLVAADDRIAQLEADLAAARAEADRLAEMHERLRRDVSQAGTPYWKERDTMNALVLDNGRLRADADRLRGICGDVVRYHIRLIGRRPSEDRRMPPDWYDLVDRAASAIDATPATGQGAALPAPPADAGAGLLTMAREVLEELVLLDLDGKLSRRQQVATEKLGVAVAAAEAARPSPPAPPADAGDPARPVICIGLPIFARLLRGQTVVLEDAVLIPADDFDEANRHAEEAREVGDGSWI